MVFRILRCSLSALLFLVLMICRFIIWLLLFFSVFHCLLNILAEVTMFGDRLLYEDWWNATTILVSFCCLSYPIGVLEEVERTDSLLVSAPRLCGVTSVWQGIQAVCFVCDVFSFRSCSWACLFSGFPKALLVLLHGYGCSGASASGK